MMGYLRKLGVLVASVFLLFTGVQGQFDDDSMEICDFCHTDGLLDCNLTEMSHINLTVSCELNCTFGIDRSFRSFDNLTMEKFSHKQICLFNNESEPITTTESTTYSYMVIKKAESFEHLETTTEGIFMEHTTANHSVDYQDDQPKETFRSDPMVNAKEELSPLLTETVTCFACGSSSDGACLNKTDKLKTVECPKTSGCISIYLDGALKRDCASSIRPEDVLLCHKPGNASCECCPYAKCNKIPWKQCYKCNSKDDPNCALWSNIETIPMAVCPNHNDNCLIHITTDGDTVRECSRADFKCLQDELCSICDGPLCNAGVFPPNRRRCVQCKECEDAQNPSDALPCPRYNPNEQCFLYVTAKSKMIRGCVSNTNDMQQCHLNEPKCITCGDTDGCNSMSLMKDANLSCSKCKSKDNPECAWAQPATAVTKCQNKVLYYLQESCMTEFDPATQAAVRDCSFDYGACTPEDQNCHTCSGNGCNRGSLKIQHCIQCSSENPEQDQCRCRADGIPSTKCPQEIQMYQTKGCYSMTKDNITTRGCIAGLTAEDLNFCETKGKAHCEFCSDDGCNNLLAPSKGWKTSRISLFTVIVIVFIAT